VFEANSSEQKPSMSSFGKQTEVWIEHGNRR
jgi:hypothetical protein